MRVCTYALCGIYNRMKRNVKKLKGCACQARVVGGCGCRVLLTSAMLYIFLIESVCVHTMSLSGLPSAANSDRTALETAEENILPELFKANCWQLAHLIGEVAFLNSTH